MVDELDELDDKDVNDSATESDEDKIARLEAENKSFKDGNSRLGREFKSYKEENDGKYDQLLDRITELTNSSTREPIDTLTDADDEDYVDLTPKKIKQIARAEAQRDREEASNLATKTQNQYVNDYSKTVHQLGENEEDAIYEAILSEMEGLPGYSSNGTADAQRNYEIAERNYYKKLYKSPKGTNTQFKGTTPAAAVGGSSTIEYKEGSDAEVNSALNDPHVQAYMKRRGKDEEFVKKAMANKTPMSGTMRL
tara:strand:+ start:13509 stop:14267 length:759 start_codon:yes stop_codon:yes gene_type:complete